MFNGCDIIHIHLVHGCVLIKSDLNERREEQFTSPSQSQGVRFSNPSAGGSRTHGSPLTVDARSRKFGNLGLRRSEYNPDGGFPTLRVPADGPAEYVRRKVLVIRDIDWLAQDCRFVENDHKLRLVFFFTFFFEDVFVLAYQVLISGEHAILSGKIGVIIMLYDTAAR
jgi:hypothetical protein